MVAGASFETDPAAFWETVTNPKTTYSLGYAGSTPKSTSANSTPQTAPIPTAGPRPQATWSAPAGGGGGGGTAPVTTAPTPTNKTQANAAGIQDTGGASASGGNPGDRELTASELRVAYKLMAALMAGKPDGGDDITSSSDDVESAMGNMDNALNSAYEKALADLPDYEKLKSDTEDLFELKKDLIDERRDALEERYADDKAEIEGEFAGKEQDMKETQKRQTGQMAGGLAAAGAYLGFDNVNHSAMLSLEVTHQRELTVLGQSKIAAINEARRAFEDADYALLGEQINAIDKYNEDITKLTQDHFDNTLKLTQEARDNVRMMQETEEFERAKSFDNLDAVVKSGKMPGPTELKKYAASLGLSTDEVKGYIQAGIDSAELEKNSKKSDEDMKLYEFLSKIDKGTYVTINGKRYAGLNKGTASSSNRIVSNTDVAKEFGSSPYAYSQVGQKTYAELVETYSLETPPEDFASTFANENLESLLEYTDIPPYILPSVLSGQFVSTMKDNAIYAYTQAAWENEKKNFWGENYGTNLKDFKSSDINIILGQLADDENRTVYIDEIRNNPAYPASKLQQLLNQAYEDRKTTDDNDPLNEADKNE
jgi:hypothetical protein